MVVFCEMTGYVIFFGVGLGPVDRLILSETYPPKVRPQAMCRARLSMWGANWLVAGMFLSLIHAAGPLETSGFSQVFAFLAFLFCFKFAPETKGRILEAIERD